jgi:hypothetical protein
VGRFDFSGLLTYLREVPGDVGQRGDTDEVQIVHHGHFLDLLLGHLPGQRVDGLVRVGADDRSVREVRHWDVGERLPGLIGRVQNVCLRDDTCRISVFVDDDDRAYLLRE